MRDVLTSILLALLIPALPVRAADPLDADPAYVAAAVAFADGRYVDAASQTSDLLKRYPRHPRLALLLADSYERAGQLQAARTVYKAVLANPSDPRIEAVATEGVARTGQAIARSGLPEAVLSPRQLAAMSVVQAQPSRRRTAHFDIVTSNDALADLLAERAEGIFDRVRRTVLGDQLFAHRVELIAYPDQEAMRKAEPKAKAWTGGGSLFVPQADGTIRRAVLLFQVDANHAFIASLLDRELPHELGHMVLREYFGQAACPLWLEEGLASMSESDGGRAVASRMPELLARQAAVPLADFIDQMAPPVDRPVAFYAQAASWTRFLRETLSEAQMKSFLAHLRDGQKPSVALQRALFLDDRPDWLSVLEQRWQRWVRTDLADKE